MNDLINNSQRNNYMEKENLSAITKKQSSTSISIGGFESVQLVSETLESETTDSGKQYFCNQCDYFTFIYDDLESHKYTTHQYSSKENPALSCWECGKEFCSEQSLKKHSKIHENKNKKTTKFSCPICHVGISRERTLKEHMKRHDINQCHLCDKCDYRTPSLKYLNQHKMVLHDSNKFSCDFCDYETVFELHLERHAKFYHKEQMEA